MKKYYNTLPALLALLLIAFLHGNLAAQHVGLTTNPMDWQNQRPNLGLQLSYPKLPWVAAYGDVTLAKSVYEAKGLKHVFSGQTTGLEVRLFPFGGRSHLRAKGLKDVSMRRKREVGCYSFAAIKRPAFSPLGGLYIAPGVELQRYDLTSTARIYEKDVTTQYEINSTGLSLHLGYQFSFEHITLGASYGFYTMKPTVISTAENIPAELVPQTNVWGFNSKQGLRLAIGVSF